MSIQDILFNTVYGAKRREAILQYLSEGNSFHVNRHWCINLKYDIDLQYLLKKKKIQLKRESAGSKSCRRTVVYIA